MKEKKKIIAVVGTRPDAIKMCPLIAELRARDRFEVRVCATGQHRELLSSALSSFGIAPDYELGIMSEGQGLFDITERILAGMGELLDRERADFVMVHGDTASAFSSALAAFYKRIPVCHVEAGLRTHDLSSPFPEEFYRRAIALMASYHFAPTEAAVGNLLSEGIEEGRIFVTGNTVLDALKLTERENISHPLVDFAKEGRTILLTAHRRENQGEAMRSIFGAVLKVLKDFPDVRVIYPVHPSPAVRAVAEEMLSSHPRIALCDPLDVGLFHSLLSECYIILTDSGGVQEEALSLRRPVLVIRNTTERGEGVLSGGIRLVGTSEGSVYRGIRALLESRSLYYAMTQAKNPFGDGRASCRIADKMDTIAGCI